MTIQKIRYTRLQENKEEELLAAEGESNLKLPLKAEIPEKVSVINNEAGKLNVNIAGVVQEQDSDGVRIVSDEGLSDQNSNLHSPNQIQQ